MFKLRRLIVFLMLSFMPIGIVYVLGLLVQGGSAWLWLSVVLFLGGYTWSAAKYFRWIPRPVWSRQKINTRRGNL